MAEQGSCWPKAKYSGALLVLQVQLYGCRGRAWAARLSAAAEDALIAAMAQQLFMFPGFWLQVFIALVSVGDLMVAAPFPSSSPAALAGPCSNGRLGCAAGSGSGVRAQLCRALAVIPGAQAGPTRQLAGRWWHRSGSAAAARRNALANIRERSVCAASPPGSQARGTDRQQHFPPRCLHTLPNPRGRNSWHQNSRLWQNPRPRQPAADIIPPRHAHRHAPLQFPHRSSRAFWHRS